MTDAERDLLLALASAVLVGTNTSIYDYAAADTLRTAKDNIRAARKDVEREMEACRANAAALLVQLEGRGATRSADGLLGQSRLLGSQEPAVQCPSCGRPSRP